MWELPWPLALALSVTSAGFLAVFVIAMWKAYLQAESVAANQRSGEKRSTGGGVGKKGGSRGGEPASSHRASRYAHEWPDAEEYSGR